MGPSGLELIEQGIRLLAAEDPHALCDDVLLRSTDALLSCEDRIDGILARRMQVMHARDTTVTESGRKLKSWLVEDELRSDTEATRRTMFARALPDRPAIDAALLAGEITLEHAYRIVALINTCDPDLREVIEKELVEAARHVDPTDLGRLCRILNAQLGNTESAEERDARQYAARWLRVTRTIDGMRRIDGMLDPTGAAIVQAALHGLSTKAGEEDTRSIAQRRADALVAIAQQTLSHGDTTDSGGDPANIMVLAPLDTLRDQLDAAGMLPATINGEPVSAATVRRLACDAGIIPAVLGAHSEVLDLGRRTPTWTVAQRRALKIESEGQCRWHRCKTPVQHCQAHHVDWWSHLGTTNTSNGIYLCYFHHWLIHHSNWKIRKNPDNTIHTWRE